MNRVLKVFILMTVTIGMLVGCSTSNDSEEGNSVSKYEGPIEEALNKTNEALESDLMVFVEPVDLKDKDAVKYNLGLESSKGIKEAVSSNAMINPQAYATVLVRVGENANATKVAKEMVSGVDLMKWICVGADDAQAVVYGDLIYMVMLDSSLEGKSIEDHFAAFETVIESKVDTVVKR